MVPCCWARGAAVNARAAGDATARRGANGPAALSTALGAASPALPSGRVPLPCLPPPGVGSSADSATPTGTSLSPSSCSRGPQGAFWRCRTRTRPGTAVPPGALAPLPRVHSVRSGCSLQLGCRASPAPPAAARARSHPRPPLYCRRRPAASRPWCLPHILSSTSFSPCPCVCQAPGFQGRSACWRGPSAPVPCFLLPFGGSLSWHISLRSHRQCLLVTA